MMHLNDRTECSREPARPWRSWLAKTGIASLLLLALVAGSVTLVVPRVSSHLRVGWYLRTSQWRADARTAVAIVRFVLERGPRLHPGLADASGTNSLAIDVAQTNLLAAPPTA